MLGEDGTADIPVGGPEPPRSWDRSQWLELSSAPEAVQCRPQSSQTGSFPSPPAKITLPAPSHALLFISWYLAK